MPEERKPGWALDENQEKPQEKIWWRKYMPIILLLIAVCVQQCFYQYSKIERAKSYRKMLENKHREDSLQIEEYMKPLRKN